MSTEVKANFSKTIEWVAEGIPAETLGIMVGAPPEASTADEIFRWIADVEYLRFENCLKQAAVAGQGLICEVHEFETKYFMDPNTPPGYAVCIPIRETS